MNIISWHLGVWQTKLKLALVVIVTTVKARDFQTNLIRNKQLSFRKLLNQRNHPHKKNLTLQSLTQVL